MSTKEAKNSSIINVLPPSIFNLLAAGEVVENPAAIVKECAENSLDAGATRIEINIWRGGLDRIEIIDNGRGVPLSEIDKVFMPHATSKIATATDLETISSLGFRGEALSSIAAVARVEFITKTSDAQTAISLPSKKRIAANTGTSVTISDLFYNTPARKKFLSNPNTEKNNITSVIQKFMLANPTTQLRYTIDEDIMYDYRGKTLLDAIQAIYGDDIAENLLSCNTNMLSGYISKPSFPKRNHTYQTLLVNGRPVEGGIISTAIDTAYQNYMTMSNFPFFVLNLKIDTREVDVNVHPRKSQVKFAKETEISDMVNHLVSETIDAHLLNQHATVFSPKQDDEFTDRIKYFSSVNNATETQVKSAPHILHKYDTIEIAKNPPAVQQAFTKLSPTYRIIGTVFDTYILLSHEQSFYIIDQHAAHERLLYDELKKQIDRSEVLTQNLLEPRIMTLTPQEMSKMELAAPYLNNMGIECDPFGTNCFRITSVPVNILEQSIDTVIENILHDVKSTPPNKLSTVIQDKIIMQCCKSAIKAGQNLNPNQLQYFLEQIKHNENFTCPHGRPIIINYTKEQLEKLFSRK